MSFWSPVRDQSGNRIARNRSRRPSSPPATVISAETGLEAAFRSARIDQEEDADRHHHDRNGLAGRKRADEAPALVGGDDLEKKTNDAIGDQVTAGQRAGRRLAPRPSEKSHEQHRQSGGFVKLGRMERD